MKFWDTSAVIPLFLEEPESPRMTEVARQDSGMIVWWGTVIECRSAIARLRREKVLTTSQEDQAIRLMSVLAEAWTEVRPSETIRNIAGRLLLSHPLRAADALQLSAALTWAGKQPRGHAFVCLDHRLRDAARKEGFQIMPIWPEN
ncbi:MAG: type II toxin-antitoxin system VapC family toxin [Deltaproteobacteria bacterium]|nr:type II toxin-antitoxin system VapC family toxin [Deltaproteobacteria bacterium]